MKTFAKFTIVVILTSMTNCAYSSSYQGYVSNASVSNQLYYVIISNGFFIGPASSCETNSAVFSVDPSTAAGRAMIATILTAKVTGRLVFTSGSNSCSPGDPYGNGSEVLTTIDLKG